MCFAIFFYFEPNPVMGIIFLIGKTSLSYVVTYIIASMLFSDIIIDYFIRNTVFTKSP